jgi:hypothetical protein
MNNHMTHQSRKNGLDRPLGFAQIAAWMTYGISILQYCFFVTPLLPPCIISPTVSIFFFLSAICVYIYGSHTILINPIDVHLHQFRCSQEQQQQQQQQQQTENGQATTAATAAKICKPIIIRNPLHQPPISYMINNNNNNNNEKRNNQGKIAARRKQATKTTTATPSLTDRLYYRTNAKQLQLYNAHHHHDHQPMHEAYNSTEHQQQQQQQRLPSSLSLPNEPMKQCWICDTSVAEHSMHCKFCNKCVYGFDHHCICTFWMYVFLFTTLYFFSHASHLLLILEYDEN